MNNQFDGLVSSQNHYNLFHLALDSTVKAGTWAWAGKKVTKPWLKILKKIHHLQHLLRRMVVDFIWSRFHILFISISIFEALNRFLFLWKSVETQFVWKFVLLKVKFERENNRFAWVKLICGKLIKNHKYKLHVDI